MKKLHIALTTKDIHKTVVDYSQRLGEEPCSYVSNEYALWRTGSLNISVRQDTNKDAGLLRHLGWEDPSAKCFTEEQDVNGILWENFSATQQAGEINALWPEAKYRPKN